MPKPTLAADATSALRVTIVTLDNHLASTVERARRTCQKDMPGLSLTLHAASDWADSPQSLERCRNDIGQAHIVVVTMLFMEDHVRPILDTLIARRDHCDAMVCCMSTPEVVKLTRMGKFDMSATPGGIVGLLKKLRGSGKSESGKPERAGAQQMKMLRRLPQILRFIPGTAQDVRAYFLCLQYWLAGSEENVANLVRSLADRYAQESVRPRRGMKIAEPREYPETGLYHPRLGTAGRVTDRLADLPPSPGARGTVGLLVMRAYVLAGNTAHYDGVIAALEARDLRVLPVFASGLDARPAIESFLMRSGKPAIDCFVSLTGFSLVGGPAYNDAEAAAAILQQLDVPYIAAQPLEFQTLEQWQQSERGLLPVEATMMVAIPELDGATGSMVFGGRSTAGPAGADMGARDMVAQAERAAMLASRVAKQVALARQERALRKVAIVLFNFPPNGGNAGTAMHLAVFESLFNTLKAMKAGGYSVDVPDSVDALRDQIIAGNASRHGTTANVAARITADDHVRREPWLAEIEAQWGPAPGKQQSDGSGLFVLGARFGNVFVGIQPAFGHEGDPMRMLFERGFAPTHAFSAFYRWVREDFGADAVLHFGTHGALEFMPGKQVGLSSACWPDRLIGSLPNFYLYASNNPSEGTLAKRRGNATLLSYTSPPIAEAGLYRDLQALKTSLERWRQSPDMAQAERSELAKQILEQAHALDLAAGDAGQDDAVRIEVLRRQLVDLEQTLIPHGLHVVGESADTDARVDILSSMASSQGAPVPIANIRKLVEGAAPESLSTDASVQSQLTELLKTDALLQRDHELPALLRALDGKFIPPAPGGDLLRTPDVLPSGRNLHGFDPFKLPSAFAMKDGTRQAERLLQRHVESGHALPESVALVLWGTDNLKSEGAPIAQALALMGARPRFDHYGRLCGAELVPLAELGRPRIDVVMTLSGIFRDLLPLQTRLLAEAAWLAASADEPVDQNFVRRNALAHASEHCVDLETAALRVFSNADGAYGANVGMLVNSSRWDDEDELAETYSRRKSFAYGRSGKPVAQPALLKSILSGVDLAYQNLESVEVGVTTVDVYFDTLGGISRAAQRARRAAGRTDAEMPVYISDQTQGEGAIRTLSEQIAIEARTRALNPKWHEAMLRHGFEGVRQIEEAVSNTMGWSATTGQVQPWVYQELSKTFMLDPAMRDRMARLNPTASARVANRLLEAHDRKFWTPDAETLDALRRAGEELEDRLEGVYQQAAA
ncbi:MAG: magnesium chelatase subunit H [Burkholderiales bacterium]|nr:magnesium chelatase subunit H [Burkholderiales bacterium]